MTNKEARELSHKLTNQEIHDMLIKAQNEIKDWTVASRANRGLSRGVHWNIFCKDFKKEKKYNHLLKFRIIQEYFEFLPEQYKKELIEKKKKPENFNIIHQDPVFL